MKLIGTLAAGGLALAALASPAVAQHTRTTVTHTTVKRVHGPVHILPHHNRKICTYTHLQGKRVKKCHYH